MTIILVFLLIASDIFFLMAVKDAVENERKFKKILEDFKKAKDVDEFYRDIERYL